MATFVETVSRWPKERSLPDVVRLAGCRPVSAASIVEVATLALYPTFVHLLEAAPADIASHVDAGSQLGRLLVAARNYPAADGATSLARWLSGSGLAPAERERYRVPARPDERVTLDYVCRLVNLARHLKRLDTVKLAFCWCPTAQALTNVPREAITDRCVAGGLTLVLVTRGHR